MKEDLGKMYQGKPEQAGGIIKQSLPESPPMNSAELIKYLEGAVGHLASIHELCKIVSEKLFGRHLAYKEAKLKFTEDEGEKAIQPAGLFTRIGESLKYIDMHASNSKNILNELNDRL